MDERLSGYFTCSRAYQRGHYDWTNYKKDRLPKIYHIFILSLIHVAGCMVMYQY